MEKKIVIDNKYLIKEEKGKGGTSKVFLVEEEKTKKLYAAKILNDYKYFDIEVEILNELKNNNKININNIVNLIDSGFADITLGHSSIKKPYLILEYAPKGDLSSYIKIPERGFKEEHAKLIFNKILKGVQDIHNSGICHRDLKTQNILLDNQYNPKICDFGFATYISKNLKDWVGTTQYAAPEIHKNGPYDGVKIDIFSLGVILFNLVTGKYGFKEAKMENKLYILIKHKNYDTFWKKNNEVEILNELKKKIKLILII